MKVYQVVFDENDMEGVYALSVVEDPAMMDHFIAFSEHKIELATIDEDKRLLLGAALIPDTKILRIDGEGNEFFITFTAETIEKLSHSFLKNGRQNNSTLEHEVKLEDMSVVESWIVQDPKNDKSNKYGKTYDKGTWVAMVKVDNNDIWEKAKKGEIKGFSIEALLGLEKINFNKQSNMTKQDLKDFGDNLLNEVKTIFSAEKPAEEIDVKSEEVVDSVEESIEVATESDEEIVEEIDAPDMDALIESMKQEMSAIKAEFSKKLEEVTSKKDEEIESLKAELSKQPEVEPIKANPEGEKKQVKFNKSSKVTTHGRAQENIAKAMGW
jgi:hypothetical protein